MERARRLNFSDEWRQQDAARKLVRRELVAGRLRQQPCEVCGAWPSQAHHQDYARPLDVVWLCRVHHRREHARLTLVDVRTIRAAAVLGASQASLARHYRLDPKTVSKIVRRLIWADV